MAASTSSPNIPPVILFKKLVPYLFKAVINFAIGPEGALIVLLTFSEVSDVPEELCPFNVLIFPVPSYAGLQKPDNSGAPILY